MAGRQKLEELLGARGLAATVRGAPTVAAAPPNADVLARLLEAGPAERAITELVPAEGTNGNAGLTSLACRILSGQSRAEGARLAWVDPLDRWDPASAQAAGVTLEKVLWLRGGAALAGLAGLSRWHEALGLLIQTGGMNLVVADFSDWPVGELRHTPRSAWFRLLRGLERSQRTSLLLLAPEPLTQSCAALVVALRYEAVSWPATSVERLERVRLEARVLRRRYLASEDRRPMQTATALHLPLELPA